MKFQQFLNENPLYADIKNDPELANRQYKRDQQKNKVTDEWSLGDYKIFEYKGSYGTTNLYVVLNDHLELYIAYSINNIKGLGKMIQNSYVQKAVGSKMKTSDIIEFIKGMITHLKTDGIISDDIQSEKGGKVLWKNILMDGHSTDKEIGVYDNFDNKVLPKEKEKKFALWYAIKSREIYGNELEKARYQLYMKA